MKVVFENKGELDIDAMTTFGVSVKEEGAIGKFGTGGKIAIGVILRLGGSVVIHSGLSKYEFTTKPVDIRGKTFDMIYMNDDKLGFTTQTGKEWEPWMAVRELLCNCKDEGGSYYESDSEITPNAGHTYIEVDCEPFLVAYKSIDEHILNINKLKLVDKTPSIEVYDKPTNKLYYKGVDIFTSNKPFLYTYNLLNSVDLTEDRTIKYEHYQLNYNLSSLLASTENSSVMEKLVTCGSDYKEYLLEYQSNVASKIVMDRVNRDKGVVDSLCPPGLLSTCKPELTEQLKEKPQYKLTDIEELQITKATSMLLKSGLYEEKYPVKVVDTLGEKTLGLADTKNQVIYLSKALFDLGTKHLAATLYEEFIHIRYNVKDETRPFQDHVINALMSQVEINQKEPF